MGVYTSAIKTNAKTQKNTGKGKSTIPCSVCAGRDGPNRRFTQGKYAGHAKRFH